MQSRLTPLMLLAALAVLVRGLVPAGWMPAGDGAGGVQVVICTGTGAHTLALGRDGKPLKHAPGEATGTCAFAATASAPPPEPVGAVAEPAVVVVAASVAPVFVLARSASLRHAWPPAQGPPLSA